MNYALIMPCAGQGSRMGLGYNKLFYVMANGKTVLENSLKLFLEDERCRQIILSCAENDFAKIKDLISDPKVSMVPGGKTRQESVAHALQEVSEEYVLVHDGARPYLDAASLERLLDCLKDHDACLLMVPVKDTVKVVKDGVVVRTPNRSELYLAQTPQAFRTALLKKAYEQNITASDDSSLVERIAPVYVVRGDYGNIKITTPEDLGGKNI